jgi:hypothetical protein
MMKRILLTVGAVLLGAVMLIMYLFSGLSNARAAMSSRHGRR